MNKRQKKKLWVKRFDVEIRQRLNFNIKSKWNQKAPFGLNKNDYNSLCKCDQMLSGWLLLIRKENRVKTFKEFILNHPKFEKMIIEREEREIMQRLKDKYEK